MPALGSLPWPLPPPSLPPGTHYSLPLNKLSTLSYYHNRPRPTAPDETLRGNNESVLPSANTPKSYLTASALKQTTWTSRSARFPWVCSISVPTKGKKITSTSTRPQENV